MAISAGIDTRMLQHTGIGTYIKNLLSAWSVTGATGDFVFTAHGDSDGVPPGFRWRKFDAPIYSLREQAGYLSRLPACNLWHSPHYNVPLIKGKTRLVTTIHDIIHWVFRKKYLNPVQAAYAGFMLRRAVTLSDQIIVVSESTKNDLAREFGADPGKITVIYQGVSDFFKQDTTREEIQAAAHKYSLPQKFFLYVGMLKPHKNVPFLIESFLKAKKEGLQGSLVIMGRKDPAFEKSFPELAAKGRQEDIFYLSGVSKNTLRALYQSACALVHPSLYEGFGLTLLEAMAGGTPVIALRTSSIPEVAGDAGLLVDPAAENGLAEAMLRMERSAQLRDELSVKGRSQAEKFSWKDTARKTIQVYQRAMMS